VLDDERIVGIVDESDLLYAVHDDQSAFQRPVQSIMSTKLETVQVNATLESLLPLFDRGLVVIVCEGTEFLGLITRIDMLNYLRRKVY
jgi:cystathionine beta-synthase